MDALAGFFSLAGLVLLALGVVTLVEFLAIGFRVRDLKKQVRALRSESEQQTRHLAAISNSLAVLINLGLPRGTPPVSS